MSRRRLRRVLITTEAPDPALISALLRHQRGVLARTGRVRTPRICAAPSEALVRGSVVFGPLPLRLAALAYSITESDPDGRTGCYAVCGVPPWLNS